MNSEQIRYKKSVNEGNKFFDLHDILNIFTFHSSLFTKAIAFTLAETLIVMGVIGVVAALTLPNLNQSTGNKEKIAKVKKIYSELNDAFGRAEAVYGSYSTWPHRTNLGFLINRLSDFFKYSKICVASNSACIVSASKMATGGEATSAGSFSKGFVLADGAVVTLNSVTSFAIDLDGANKGKNSFCSDVFYFDFGPGGVVTPSYKSGAAPNQYNCSAWVILYDNMDYLKTSDMKTCPNGTVLGFDTNTTCK